MNEESLFVAALEITDPRERNAFLEHNCRGDRVLRQRIENLLAGHDSSNPLDRPPPALVTQATDPAPGPVNSEEHVGSLIGPYRLMEKIGEGGFGLVFVAEQEEPVRRRVALKVIKPGMDSRQVIARFEAERQALAMMNHINIAKVLDAGTTASGRPYFAMELVHGVPITTFCDKNKLTPRERLDLFVSVCQAIHHAHQKGVIHRDIKPSNVLVTMYDDVPVPKVIDFGIAKAVDQRLTEKTIYTQYGTMVGTFEYVSPEQAEMNAFGVDTRSDIYSLGVLLYELLTGATPLDKSRLREAAYGEIIRIIKEEEPPRPSLRLSRSETLAKVAAARRTEPGKLPLEVRGELDWIVMRCLEKDRSRRYEGASALARDVQSYLSDERVDACPPTVRYRMRKIYRKQRTAVLTAGAFVLVLLVALAVSMFSATRAMRARQIAMNQRQIATENAHRALANEAAARRERDEAIAARTQLEHEQYARTIQLAQREWTVGNASSTRRLLDNARPALRGWEWRFLNRVSHSAVLSIDAHPHSAYAEYSPDGQRILTMGPGPGAARIWDAGTGECLVTIEAQADNGWQRHATFSADGNMVAINLPTSRDSPGHGTSQTSVWNTQTGKKLWTLRHEYPVGCLALHPSNDHLAVARFNAHRGGTDEESSGQVSTWELTTGKKLQEFKDVPAAIMSLVYSPDGTALLTGNYSEPSATLWNLATGRRVTLSGHSGPVQSAQFSSDGSQVVTAGTNGEVRIWDADSGQQLQRIVAHNDVVRSAVFNATGDRVVSAGRDQVARVWNVKTGQLLRQLPEDSEIRSVAFSPDGKQILTGTDEGAVHVRPTQPAHVREFKAGSEAVSAAFTSDGRNLLVLSDEAPRLCLRDPETGAITRRFDFEDQQLAPASFGSLSLRQNRFAVSLPDGNVRIWNLTNGKLVRSIPSRSTEEIGEQGNHSPFSAPPIDLSPDGKRIVMVVGDEIQVRDTDTGATLLTFTGHANQAGRPVLFNLEFSRDGTRIASRGFRSLIVWNSRSGDEVLRISESGFGIGFSPDGSRIATGGKVVRLYDCRSGSLVHELVGHARSASSVIFSPDGERLVSAGAQAIRLWDVETGNELMLLPREKQNSYREMRLSFSPDGRKLVACDGSIIRVYDVGPESPQEWP